MPGERFETYLQKVFTTLFCRSQFPHKFVNLSFATMKNALADLCGYRLLQNHCMNTLREINLFDAQVCRTLARIFCPYTTRWTTTLLSNVNFPHAIYLRTSIKSRQGTEAGFKGWAERRDGATGLGREVGGGNRARQRGGGWRQD